MSGRTAGPFSARGGAILALIGIVGFLLVLWAMGNAMDQSPTTTAEATGRGRGFDGYAAMAQYLEKRGFKVDPLQSEVMLDEPGLLILTPPHNADTAKLGRMVRKHRRHGPVIVVTPKWKPMGAPQIVTKGKYAGQQVEQLEPKVAHWPGWYDDIALDLYPMSEGPQPGQWSGLGVEGKVPDVTAVVSGEGDSLIPLVVDTYTDRTLAGYIDDGDYPELAEAAPDYAEPQYVDDGQQVYPLILVFEPDIINNYGFAKRESSALAERLVRTALSKGEKRVMFDLMLNGYVNQQQKGPSLLKQAFKPPFLAATICLILAIVVAFWRALHRFGPALLATRSIAFGKRALVANAAGLVQRARRLHLLGPPYADAARDRLSRALALPARLDPAEAEIAIDRALAVRAPGTEPFSSVAARLRAARRPADLLSAARHLHSLERTLMR